MAASYPKKAAALAGAALSKIGPAPKKKPREPLCWNKSLAFWKADVDKALTWWRFLTTSVGIATAQPAIPAVYGDKNKIYICKYV